MTSCLYRRLWPFIAAGASAILLAAPGDQKDQPNRALPDRDLFRPGRYVYERNCLVCHGPFGDGKGELVQDWEVSPRDFQDAAFKYRSTPYGALPTNEDMMRTARRGVSGTAMPAFQALTERELRAVVEYIKYFSSKWWDEVQYQAPIELPNPPAWINDPDQKRKRQALGRSTFLVACASCHGGTGAGAGLAAPTLTDSKGRAVQPADLTKANYRSGPELADVYRAIATGMTGTPMPGFAETLTEEQIWEVAVFLEELR